MAKWFASNTTIWASNEQDKNCTFFNGQKPWDPPLPLSKALIVNPGLSRPSTSRPNELPHQLSPILRTSPEHRNRTPSGPSKQADETLLFWWLSVNLCEGDQVVITNEYSWTMMLAIIHFVTNPTSIHQPLLTIPHWGNSFVAIRLPYSQLHMITPELLRFQFRGIDLRIYHVYICLSCIYAYIICFMHVSIQTGWYLFAINCNAAQTELLIRWKCCFLSHAGALQVPWSFDKTWSFWGAEGSHYGYTVILLLVNLLLFTHRHRSMHIINKTLLATLIKHNETFSNITRP